MLRGVSLVIALICVRGVDNASPELDAPPGRLFRLDPVEIGFERVLELEPGKMFTVQTVSTKPPVFEIHNFLSDSECDHIRHIASEQGLDNSTVIEDPRTRFTQELDETQQVTQDKDEHILSMFEEFDWSQDGLLDAREVLDILPPETNAFMSLRDVHELFADLGIDRNSDGFLDLDEYKVTSEADIRDWMQKKMHSDKTRVVRESKQVWLSQNDADDVVLRSLRERVIALTRLPRILIEGSELLQVVKYSVGGHYHAHYDSEEINSDLPCHHSTIVDEQSDDIFFREHRLCRYITLLYYLNDVDDGGQTAFPLAGNETVNEDELAENSDTIFDLSHHCKDAKLIVEPVKGKAVMWYNHRLDETGWLGEMDEFALHGGCDVHSGTKWIANNWINVDNIREKQEQYQKELESEVDLEFYDENEMRIEGEHEYIKNVNDDVTKSAILNAENADVTRSNLKTEETRNVYANDEL